jgi:hypothetical protein
VCEFDIEREDYDHYDAIVSQCSEADGIRQLALWDVRTGWVAGNVPDHLRGFELAKGEPEELFLVDESGDGQALDFGGDRPDVLALSRDGRYAWVGEDDDTAIIDLATAQVMLRLGWLEPSGSELRIYDDQTAESACGPGAVALRGNDWWWLDEDGRLGVDLQTKYRVRGFEEWFAAAFNASGSRLALLTEKDEVVVIDVDNSRVVHRWGCRRWQRYVPSQGPSDG